MSKKTRKTRGRGDVTLAIDAAVSKCLRSMAAAAANSKVQCAPRIGNKPSVIGRSALIEKDGGWGGHYVNVICSGTW